MTYKPFLPKLSLWLLAILTAAAIPAAKAQDVKVGNLNYRIADGSAKVLSLASSSVTTIDIPAEIEHEGTTYKVTALLDSAFYNKTKITKVTLGGNVTSVGVRCFQGCTKLATVEMDSALTTLSTNAFYNCKALKNITWSPRLASVGSKAFYGCEAIAGTISFTTALKEMHPGAFLKCTKITGCTVDADNADFQTVDGILFSKDRTRLVWYPAGIKETTYTLPNTVTEILQEAFRTQGYLTSVVLPEGLKSIGVYAFADCGLTSINLPASLTTMGNAPFYSCRNLETVNLASGNDHFTVSDHMIISRSDMRLVQAYGTMAASVTIPEGVSSIAPYAFYNNASVERVKLPSTLQSIGNRSFCNATLLKEIDIPSSVNSIASYAFRGCSSMTKAHLPAGLKRLHQGLFYECGNLETVNLPDALERIDSMCFQNCARLQNVTFPATLRIIDLQGFDRCASLTEAILNDGLKEIGENAFLNCDNLIKVRIPASVEKWGSSAFFHIDSLRNLELCEGLTTLGFQSFSWARSLTHVTLPASLKVIEQSAFLGCSLTEVTLPENLETLGDQAFAQSKLTHFQCSDNLTEIGRQTFYKCVNLKSFKAGAGLKTIGERAFRECDSLTDVQLNEGLKTIVKSAFVDCSSLTKITLPSTITSLGQKCFYNCPLVKIRAKMNKPTPLAAANKNFGGASFSIYETCILSVPEGKVEDYKKATVWKEFAHIDGTASAGSPIEEAEITDIYNLQGIRLEAPVRGQVNIIRYSDGTVKRVIP